MNRGGIGRQSGYYVVSIALAILFVAPLLWSGWASVSGQAGTAQQSGYGVANYRALASYGEGLSHYARNSALVSLMTVVGTMAVSFFGGYAFSRFRFPGRNVLFLVTLAILMVPYTTLLIPLYVLLGWLHVSNSLFGLSLVLIMFQLPFSTFMMRISFDSVPRELDESALVDGCSSLGALVRVLLRAVRPGLITVGLFAFLASWNDFVAPLILLNDGSKFTLPVAVVSMREQTFGAIDYGALEAGVVVMAVPCLILFVFLQRHYVRGFMAGALKG